MLQRSYKSEMVQSFPARVKVVVASFLKPRAVYPCIPMCRDGGVAFGFELAANTDNHLRACPPCPLNPSQDACTGYTAMPNRKDGAIRPGMTLRPAYTVNVAIPMIWLSLNFNFFN